MTLRSRAIQPKEARLACVGLRSPTALSRTCLLTWLPTLSRHTTRSALASTRDEQLADLLVAVQDKGRSVEFEAGLRGRKRRKLAGGPDRGEGLTQGLEQFKQRFSDAKMCVALPSEPVFRQLTLFILAVSSNSTSPLRLSLPALLLLRGRSPHGKQSPQRRPNLRPAATL